MRLGTSSIVTKPLATPSEAWLMHGVSHQLVEELNLRITVFQVVAPLRRHLLPIPFAPDDTVQPACPRRTSHRKHRRCVSAPLFDVPIETVRVKYESNLGSM